MTANSKEQKFTAVLEQYKDRLFRICRAYGKTTEEQEDLFQEVVYNIWRSFDQFRQDSGIYTWLYRITLNVCMRKHYQFQRDQQRQVQLEGIQFIQPAVNSSEQSLETKEESNTLYQCIHQLKEADRSIILLFLEDLPYKEIAKIMGITENHVAVKIKRIKQHLYECFKTLGYV